PQSSPAIARNGGWTGSAPSGSALPSAKSGAIRLTEMSSAISATQRVLGLRLFKGSRLLRTAAAWSVVELSRGPIRNELLRQRTAALDELVDFSLINDKVVRLAVGAVNVLNGNFVYFDNAHEEIVSASAACRVNARWKASCLGTGWALNSANRRSVS